MKTYKCLNCGVECLVGSSKRNKYCSLACQHKYRWRNDTIPRIERGECTGAESHKRYLAEVFGCLCSECGIGPEWNGKPLTLQVDHIDGDSDNNFPSNLRLLCPNCHTQTSTYGSKGKGNRYKKKTKRSEYLIEYYNGRVAQR